MYVPSHSLMQESFYDILFSITKETEHQLWRVRVPVSFTQGSMAPPRGYDNDSVQSLQSNFSEFL